MDSENSGADDALDLYDQLRMSGKRPDPVAFAAKYPKHTAFVVYCSSATCPDSRQLVERLIQSGGFADVSNMPGGYAEYRAAEPHSHEVKQ